MSWSSLWEAKVLSDETDTTKEVHLQDGKTDHGIEVVVTGAGTITLTPHTSISGKDWVSNGTKLSAFDSTSGPGSDGKQIVSLLLKPSEFIKFVIVATGDVGISLWFTQK